MSRIRNLIPLLLTICCIAAIQHHAYGQDNGRAWALKAGMGGIFTGHISGEAEVFLKGRLSFAVRGALIHPTLDSPRSPGTGFFVKAGPKFYFSSEKATTLSGFAVKPEIVFSNWRDWDARVFVVATEVWEKSLGVLVNLSYGWQPFDHVLIEPHAGIGYVPTFEKANFRDDQQPGVVYEQGWLKLVPDEIRGGNHSHIAILPDIGVSFGLNVGIRF